jgi:hypothetical protein
MLRRFVAVVFLVVHVFDFADELVGDSKRSRDFFGVLWVKPTHIDAPPQTYASNRANTAVVIKIVGNQTLFWERIERLNQLAKECLSAFAANCACDLTAPPTKLQIVEPIRISAAAHANLLAIAAGARSAETVKQGSGRRPPERREAHRPVTLLSSSKDLKEPQ